MPAYVAILPSQYGGIVLICESCEHILVVQQSPNVFFKFSDDFRIGKKPAVIPLVFPQQILSYAALFAVRAVADQSDGQAKSTFVCGLDRIINYFKRLWIENSRFGLDAEIASYAIAQSLRTHHPGSHHSGGVEDVVHFKMRRVSRAQRIVRPIGFHSKPLDVRAAIAKVCASQHQLRSASQHEFIVMCGLCRILSTHRRCGYRHEGQSPEHAFQSENSPHLFLRASDNPSLSDEKRASQDLSE
jgi:hypothetical protein